MKSFIKVILSVVALGLVSSVSMLHAQEGEGKKGGKGGKGGGMLTAERVEQAVGTLTDEQKTKIGDIIKKADLQNASPEERREKMQTLNKDIRAVLTPEQQKKWDDRPQGGKGGGKKKQN